MGESTIEWTDYTFNAWMGCAKVHAGCTNCYAENHQAVAMRKGGKVQWGEVWQGGQRVVMANSTWKKPLAWARAAARAGERKRVFCSSLADVLEVPVDPPGGFGNDAFRAGKERARETRDVLEAARQRLWGLIRQTHRVEWKRQGQKVAEGGLDWLLLTKRPENWSLVPEDVRPLVWLGTSVSDQKTAEEWVPRLLNAQGFRYRFLSMEPLLGPVDLAAWIERIDHCGACGAENAPQEDDACPECGRSLISTWGNAEAERYRRGERYTTAEGAQDMEGRGGLGWVIVGGESGNKARPLTVGWVQSIVKDCAAAGVPCFVKQVGANPFDGACGQYGHGYKGAVLKLKDSHGGDWDEWPEDLRVRQFPGEGS